MTVTVDGRLDEPAWREAAVLERWVETTPGDNVAPTARTVAYLTYDAEHLYVAVVAYDVAGQILYRRHARDAVSREAQDWIQIRLDTYNDRRRAFTFAVNPIGIQGDGIHVEGSGFEDWDGIWYAAGTVHEDHYVVEVAIPFKSLRYPGGESQRWGVGLARTYGRSAAKDSPWPLDRDLACELCQLATLTGIGEIGRGAAIELNPALVARGEKARPELDAPFGQYRGEVEIGANLKVGVTPNLTLDGTVNPDFSQVEADAGQLEINNRFALFFPEKRPFFLEGTDLFRTQFQQPGQIDGFFQAPLTLVYTRRMVDPEVGLKLTGKSGRLSYGAFGVLDDARPYVLDSVGGVPGGQLDPHAGSRSRFLVARGQVTTLRDGFVGLAGTYRALGDGYSTTLLADTRLRFGPNWSVRAMASRSEGREQNLVADVAAALSASGLAPDEVLAALDEMPADVADLDGESLSGAAVQAKVEFQNRFWNIGLGYHDISPRYETQVGFTPRSNYAALSGYVEFTHRSTGFLQRVTPALQLEYGYEHTADRLFALGRSTDRIARIWVDATLPNANTLNAGVSAKTYVVDGITFEGIRGGWLFGESRVTRWLNLNGSIEIGRTLIFDDVVDDGPARAASNLELTLSSTFRPVAPLSMELGVRGETIWRRTPEQSRESRYAKSVIPRVRVLYQLTRALGMRGIAEYRYERFYRQDGALHRKRDQLYYDLLLTYLIQPQQSLQAGFTQLYGSDLATPLIPHRRGGLVKLSYVWRW